MKPIVRYLFRGKDKGGNSIEEIFFRLAEEPAPSFEKEKQFERPGAGFWRNLWYFLWQPRPAIYHITGAIYPYAMFLWLRAPVVTTIHDIGRYKELRGWRKWLYGWLWIKGPYYCSAALTVVSSFTKEDMVAHFGLKASKIKVIHNPYPVNFTYHPAIDLAQPPIILQLGTAPHKNLSTLIAAVEGLAIRLHIVGQLTQEQQALLAAKKIAYQSFYKLSYEAIYGLYRAADIVTFVSLHEGFGMPIIEAQAVGRPVISSTNCSLPEIGGAGGVYYIQAATDAAELRAAIKALLEDASLRARLVAAGRENVKRFEMQQIAAAYQALYQQIVSN